MEMKHGCTVMAPKLNKIYHNGNTFMTTFQQGKLSSMQQQKGNAYFFFFHPACTVHQEYAPQGQTVTQYFYLEVLRCLHNTVHNKLARKWQSVALRQPPFYTTISSSPN